MLSLCFIAYTCRKSILVVSQLQVVQWDLSIERDDEVQGMEDEKLLDVPPQLLFIHQVIVNVALALSILLPFFHAMPFQ